MRVHGEFARDGMSKVAEHSGGVFHAMADSSEELAAVEALFDGGNGLRLSHAGIATELRLGRMLLLF